MSEKLYYIFGTFLPILQYNGNVFQNVPKLRIPKIANNIFLDAMHTLQNCQQTKGVLGGAILYHNKIVASQLSDNVTKNIVFTDPHRIKSTAEIIAVNFHVPNGVQMICVYISANHFNMLFADAFRSQTLQTQHLSNNTNQSNFQKRKIKRDRSLIFSNIPEEYACDQIEKLVGPLRPTNLPLKETAPKNLNYSEVLEEGAKYQQYLGRTSVCSTPLTENKVLHGCGVMSICANPNENSNASKTIRNSFGIDFEKIFSKFAPNTRKIERRNSFTDFQDSVKNISKQILFKKTQSSYKIDLSCPNTEQIPRSISDPVYSSPNNSHESKKKLDRKSDEEIYVFFEEKYKSNKNTIQVDNSVKNTKITSDYRVNPKEQYRISFVKKSLSLPLKTQNDTLAENMSNNSVMPIERRRMSGIQLTPLMAKLSVLALTEERYYSKNCNDNNSQENFCTTPSEERKGNKLNFIKERSPNKTSEQSIGFEKVEMYICGQQNMTMFLLLEHGSAHKQEIVQTMFDKCVAKLGKIESLLHQTLNVDMMEGPCEGGYSLIYIDSKWDTLLNHGPWTPLDQSFLEQMRSDLNTEKLITDIFLRTGDCIVYGYKSGRKEFFFKESTHYFTGIPPPSDPMGTIARRAKACLEEDFSIVLF